ncbi:hypothetical protein [Deinococcus aquaedulcis]|uniref:hypothetical protein n=1 Tax=Deinococcus aquaedulcis TaxID=2840455 RepID=UPI001C837414|nr:hypothetical protein [Deinococcus aquaedulcis]
MNRLLRPLLLLPLLVLPAEALGNPPVPVPREKVTLRCTDSYFKASRDNFLLADETYPTCTLRLPLALTQRWPGARTFFLIPRVSATLYAKDARGQGQWLPLAPLVNPGPDPLHRAVSAAGYEAVELSARLGKLTDAAGERTPDTVSAGGKLTVCAAPVPRNVAPCTTFDIAARFKVYRRG